MTIDEAIIHAEEVAEIKKIESETAEIQGCDRYALKCEECAEEHRQLAEWLRDYKRLKEQESKTEKVIKMRDATPEEQEAIAKYIKSISKPTGIVFDEEQEQLDFVQPHKRIPVTLTVESGDLISRQAVLDTISELNAISFYEAQEDSKECYYEIRQAIKDLSPVKLQEPKTGHWIIIDDCEKFIAKCSECGQIEDSRMIGKYAYCHCGARMSENPTGSKPEISSYYGLKSYVRERSDKE